MNPQLLHEALDLVRAEDMTPTKIQLTAREARPMGFIEVGGGDGFSVGLFEGVPVFVWDLLSSGLGLIVSAESKAGPKDFAFWSTSENRLISLDTFSVLDTTPVPPTPEPASFWERLRVGDLDDP